jgi:ATP-binding cassette, subfamily B, bacterial CvaB/MchF/RaxB
VEKTIANIESAKLQGNEQGILNGWYAADSRRRNSDVRFGKLGLRAEAWRTLIMGSAHVITIYAGSVMVTNLSLSVGRYMGFIILKSVFISAFARAIGKFQDLRSITDVTERLSDVVSHDTEYVDFALNPFHGRPDGRLALNGVTFTYPGERSPAVSNISFAVKAGEILQIDGPSGSGKSTLIRLMCGLLNPTAGDISVGDRPLASVGLREYRSHIAHVSHGTSLVPGSIIDNIVMNGEEVAQERLVAAATTARIHDFIMKLPMSYLTMIGDLGSIMSGGQAQRILLARALYKRPVILFLDEALSNLEDRLSIEILKDIARTTTVVLVTHSRDLANAATHVIRIRRGRLDASEFGAGITSAGDATKNLV